MPARTPNPAIMEGRYVRLEPLTLDHIPDLFRAGGGDDGVWYWLPVVTPATEFELRVIVEQRLAQQAAGALVLFTVRDRRTGRPAGWIAYRNISVSHERLDIGWQWLARELWDTPALVEMHVLLAGNAFDNLLFSRVQWQLDHQDRDSQLAVTRIGAEREGILRHHGRRSDGSWRDTVIYGLLAPDWPQVKERLRSGAILG